MQSGRKVPSNIHINTFCRKDKNCITVEQMSEDKEMLRKSIPNPVLTFEHAFHNYRKSMFCLRTFSLFLILNHVIPKRLYCDQMAGFLY